MQNWLQNLKTFASGLSNEIQAPAVEHILTILVSFDLVTVHNFLSMTVKN